MMSPSVNCPRSVPGSIDLSSQDDSETPLHKISDASAVEDFPRDSNPTGKPESSETPPARPWFVVPRTSSAISPRRSHAARNTGRFPPLASSSSKAISPGTVTSSQRFQSEFQNVKLIGKGGFGKVYHCQHKIDHQEYAIKKILLNEKTIRKWEKGNTAGLEVLLSEIRTLAKIEHCNIVRYHTAWVEWLRDDSFVGRALDQDGSSSHSGDQTDPEGNKLAVVKHQLGEVSVPSVRDTSTSISSEEDSPDVLHFDTSSDHGPNIIFAADSKSAKGKSEYVSSSKNNALSPYSSESSSGGANIFSDGNGLLSDASAQTSSSSKNVMAVYIQMSLHPMNLARYLSPHPSAAPRHCFHLLPSLRLFRVILSGVQHLHTNSIIHRDLKPANILLSLSPFTSPSSSSSPPPAGYTPTTCPLCPGPRIFLNPRIADFGHALTTPASTSKSMQTSFGTAPYAPRAPADPLSPRADIHALGVLLFELLYQMETMAEWAVVLSRVAYEGVLPGGFVGMVDKQGKGRMRVGERVRGLILQMVAEECQDGDVSRAAKGEECGLERVREVVDGVLRDLDD